MRVRVGVYASVCVCGGGLNASVCVASTLRLCKSKMFILYLVVPLSDRFTYYSVNEIIVVVYTSLF